MHQTFLFNWFHNFESIAIKSSHFNEQNSCVHCKHFVTIEMFEHFMIAQKFQLDDHFMTNNYKAMCTSPSTTSSSSSAIAFYLFTSQQYFCQFYKIVEIVKHPRKKIDIIICILNWAKYLCVKLNYLIGKFSLSRANWFRFALSFSLSHIFSHLLLLSISIVFKWRLKFHTFLHSYTSMNVCIL